MALVLCHAASSCPSLLGFACHTSFSFVPSLLDGLRQHGNSVVLLGFGVGLGLICSLLRSAAEPPGHSCAPWASVASPCPAAVCRFLFSLRTAPCCSSSPSTALCCPSVVFESWGVGLLCSSFVSFYGPAAEWLWLTPPEDGEGEEVGVTVPRTGLPPTQYPCPDPSSDISDGKPSL